LQEDFVDSYNNLTLKSILTLKYYANLKKDKLLLLKTDDDSYVHIGELAILIQTLLRVLNLHLL
jgi:beta-1,3-galactosyltransferase 1